MKTLSSLVSQIEEIGEKIDLTSARRNKIMEFMDNFPGMCFIKNGETGKYEYSNQPCITALGDVIGKTDMDLFTLPVAKRLIGHDITVLQTCSPLLVIEDIPLNVKESRFLMVKFVIRNGSLYIGGFALALPEVFTLNKAEVSL